MYWINMYSGEGKKTWHTEKTYTHILGTTRFNDYDGCLFYFIFLVAPKKWKFVYTVKPWYFVVSRDWVHNSKLRHIKVIRRRTNDKWWNEKWYSFFERNKHIIHNTRYFYERRKSVFFYFLSLGKQFCFQWNYRTFSMWKNVYDFVNSVARRV